VFVVKKEHQRTGLETQGIISRHLTKSSYHPRGIKVMLTDGTVGRVTRFEGDAADASPKISKDKTFENVPSKDPKMSSGTNFKNGPSITRL